MKLRTLILATASAIALSGAAFAQEFNFSTDAFVAGTNNTDATLGGQFSASVTQPVGDNLDALAGLRFNLSTEAIDGFYVGLESGPFYVTYGDWQDIFIVGTHMRTVNGNPVTMTTLANPALADTQLTAGYGDLAVMAGFRNNAVNADVQNVQASGVFSLPYEVGVSLAVDYNTITNRTTYGAGASTTLLNDVSLYGAITYDTQAAYELGVGYAGFDAYVAGNEADTVRFVGAGYTYDLAENAALWVTTSYDVTNQDTKHAAGFSVKF